jgi:hypothetical protein
MSHYEWTKNGEQGTRFVLDNVGYLTDDACVVMQPTPKTSRAWEAFRKAIEQTLGNHVSKRDLLRYCIAFLNSSYAHQRLIIGHRPTPKGSYAITEEYLKEIPIPNPRDKATAEAMIALVEKLEDQNIALNAAYQQSGLEKKLEARIAGVLGRTAAQ